MYVCRSLPVAAALGKLEMSGVGSCCSLKSESVQMSG